MVENDSAENLLAEPNQDELIGHKRDRFSDKKEVSGRIGETSRFISFGLVALVFTIHGSENNLSANIVLHSKFLLNIAGLVGCLSIVSDYLQYLCGYLSVNEALARRSDGYSYNPDSLLYKGRRWFFWAKQILALSGAVIVVILFSLELI